MRTKKRIAQLLADFDFDLLFRMLQAGNIQVRDPTTRKRLSKTQTRKVARDLLEEVANSRLAESQSVSRSLTIGGLGFTATRLIKDNGEHSLSLLWGPVAKGPKSGRKTLPSNPKT